MNFLAHNYQKTGLRDCNSENKYTTGKQQITFRISYFCESISDEGEK